MSEEGSQGADGVSRIGSIILQKGDPVRLRIVPLVHELAHEMLQGQRERRELPREAMEAECVAGVLLDLYGRAEAAHDVVIASMDRIASAAGRTTDFVEHRSGEVVEVTQTASLTVT